MLESYASLLIQRNSKRSENNLPALMHFIMTNGLLMILSSVMPAVPTDDDSSPLSGPLNADSYKTVDMNYPLRQNTKKREVSLTLNAEGSRDKSENNVEGFFKRDVGEDYTNKDGVWIFPLTVPGGSNFVNLSYVVYSLAGKTFPVRFWWLNDSTLSIIVKQGDMVRLTASFNAGSYEISEDKEKRLVLKHNISSKAVSFIFDKVDDDDEGGYKIEENCTKIDGRTQVRKDIYHLYLLKPDDVKRGNVGENIIILRLNKITSSSSYLYHYDQVFTVLKDTECDVNSTSNLYGRLKCGMDKVNNRYQIEIQNVARSDSGLYRVVRDGYDTDRCFLNITEQFTTIQSSSSMPSYTVQGSFPNAASSDTGTTGITLLDNTTIQDETEGISCSPLNNESLTATLLSSENNPLTISDVLTYVIPIVVGSIGVIVLILSCRRLIKRKKSYSMKGIFSYT